MTTSSGRHAIANHTLANRKALRTMRFWVAPTIVATLLMALLAALYLGGILDPKGSLHKFPIAIVNSDAGTTAPGPAGPTHLDVGRQITEALKKNVDPQKIELRELSPEQARHQLDVGELYGQIVIPSDFSAGLLSLAQSAVAPGEAVRPVITVNTNPRAGSLSVSLVTSITGPALDAVNKQVGQQLTQQVQAGSPSPMTGGTALALSNPIAVNTTAYHPLPDNTGNGLSAFYYSLLIVFAGFTGSLVISALVDAMLGFAPSEFGPVYRFAEQAKISRFATLLVKWAMVLLLAMVVSAIYLWIAHSLGMPEPHAFWLWLYGVFGIAAVGITGTSVIAVLGTAGLLVNLIVFIIMGLPSSGATIPLEATPKLFGWLSKFEPLHQIFLGARALLYFDGRAAAGLSHALIMTGIGLAIGIALGAVATIMYDHNGFHRIKPDDLRAPTLGPTMGVPRTPVPAMVG